MPLVLKRDGFRGWSGPVDASVSIEARIAGNSQLIGVKYNKQTVPFTVVDDHKWSLQFKIVKDSQRLLLAFASPAPDDIDIVEVSRGGGPPAEQEIAGSTHATSPVLAPNIEGV